MNYFIALTAFVSFTVISFSQTQMIISRNDGTADSIKLADIKDITFYSETVNPNLIMNGGFDSSFDEWTTLGNRPNPYHPNDPGQASFTIENGMAVLDITNQGESIWSIMLYQSVEFESGESYTITFDAKSDSTVTIISNVVEDGGDWTIYSGDKYFQLTETMTTYSYQFVMPVSGEALFQFCLGMIGTPKLFFDNVILTKDQQGKAGS